MQHQAERERTFGGRYQFRFKRAVQPGSVNLSDLVLVETLKAFYNVFYVLFRVRPNGL